MMQAMGFAGETSAKDAYGFSALPAGRFDGQIDIGLSAHFWSSSESSIRLANVWSMTASAALLSEIQKHYGISVRCIKDKPEAP